MRSGEEIQAALRAFAQRWRGYGGTERSEVQTVLNEGRREYDPFRKKHADRPMLLSE